MSQLRLFAAYVRSHAIELGLSAVICTGGLVASIASVTVLGAYPLLAYCLQFVAGWCLLAISVWGLTRAFEYAISIGVLAFLRSHTKR